MLLVVFCAPLVQVSPAGGFNAGLGAGGTLAMADLTGYRVKERAPIRARYRAALAQEPELRV